MKCPKCQFENPEDSNFCLECGQKLKKKCPQCEKALPVGAKFCNGCGYKLTAKSTPFQKDLSLDAKIAKIQKYLPEGLTEKILAQRDRIEGERKQVTVMFCDMEGFTPLSKLLDIEEAYSIMDQVYEILIHKVHDYEGTVNEMTGDGIMALFGAPIAIEDAAQRAIRSSLAIHREMAKFSNQLKQEKIKIPPIKMRIGIHTGPVVVGTVGNDLRVEFKAVGDTVILASRMEGIAEPGTTYVTGGTFILTEGLFRFEALGEKEIKGREDLIPVYRAIAASTSRTRFDVSAERGLSPLVGRERELSILLDGLEQAKAGRGQAFSIMAEAGIGKSRLLYEFRKAVSSEDVTFLEGKCLSYSGDVAYHLHRDILKANFDIREDDGDPEIREKVKKGLQILGVDVSLDLPFFLELLSVKDSGIDIIAMSPEVRKNRIMEAFKQIVLKGSEIRPLILACEDLHWVDKSSEDVLKYVLESIPGARILLIFTYRPDFVHTWGVKSYHNQITLNRLSNRQSLRMVYHLLRSEELDSDLEEFILEKTEGIPFYIEELIKSLKDLKIVERADNRFRIIKDIREVAIPTTIQDVIMARIDSLLEEIKSLLQTASAVGREFDHYLIQKVTGFAEQELLSHLSALKDSELIYERGIYPQSTYIFKHAFTQEVAYGSLLLKRRKEIHERIGTAIEALYPDRLEEHYELLAYHYAQSANAEKAFQYLDLANQKMAKLNAMEEAKAYFDEAMGLLDTLPENMENRRKRISLLVNQGEVFIQLFRPSEYYDLLLRFESIANGLGNQALLGAFYSRLGYLEWASGQFDQGIKTLTKAAELCEAAKNIKDAGFAYTWLGWAHLYIGGYDRVLAVKEELLRTMKQRFDPHCYVRGLCGASRACIYLGRWDQAVEEAQKALKVAEKSSDNSLIAYAVWTLSMAYTWKGDLGRGVEYGELAMQKASTPGDKAWVYRGLGWALGRAGEVNKGIELLRAALELVRASGDMSSKIPTACILGAGYWLAGEDDKARRILEEGLEMADRCRARYYSGWAQRLLGEIALKANPDQATIYFEQSIAVLGEIKAENELALAYAGYGRLQMQQSRFAQAREYLTKALGIFERLGTLIEPDNLREILAELPEA
jgi:class 3 adenylate cyclase/tetratricopeptide (TPR) repeat protein